MNKSENNKNFNQVSPITPTTEESTQRNEDNKKDEKKEKRNMVMNIINAIVVRLLFLVQSVFLILFGVCITDYNPLLVLIILTLVVIADGLFVVIKNKGVEHKWFSVSVAAYSIIFISCVWSIVFYQININDPLCLNSTTDSTTKFCMSSSYTACNIIQLLVQLILIFFTIGRWQMKIKNLNRDEHVDLALSLLMSCADSSEFFNYIYETQLNSQTGLVTAILFIFTLSIIPFSFTITAVRERSEDQLSLSKFRIALELLLCTKLWSIILVAITLDVPFLLMRIVFLVGYKMTADRSIFLYIVKNVIVVYFDAYKTYFIVKEFYDERKKLMTKQVDNSSIFKNLVLIKDAKLPSEISNDCEKNLTKNAKDN